MVQRPDDLTLAAYLRAIRARVAPEVLGLPSGGLRRVAGLRREEVAVLSGVSVDYYTRLEQGKERHPGASVLEGIARGLALEDDEIEHLYVLAGLARPPRPVGVVGPPTAALGQLLDSWPAHPAFVIDPAHDVVAANAIARQVYAPFSRFDNLVRMIFTDPTARRFHTNWAVAADSTVASLRATAALFESDEGLVALVAELAEASPQFAERWTAQRILRKTITAKRFRHDKVGLLEFDAHTFAVQGSPGLQLVVYGYEAGSATANALVLLSAAVGPDVETNGVDASP